MSADSNINLSEPNPAVTSDEAPKTDVGAFIPNATPDDKSNDLGAVEKAKSGSRVLEPTKTEAKYSDPDALDFAEFKLPTPPSHTPRGTPMKPTAAAGKPVVKKPPPTVKGNSTVTQVDNKP